MNNIGFFNILDAFTLHHIISYIDLETRSKLMYTCKFFMEKCEMNIVGKNGNKLSLSYVLSLSPICILVVGSINSSFKLIEYAVDKGYKNILEHWSTKERYLERITVHGAITRNGHAALEVFNDGYANDEIGYYSSSNILPDQYMFWDIGLRYARSPLVVGYMILHGATITQECYNLACQEGNLEIIKYFVERQFEKLLGSENRFIKIQYNLGLVYACNTQHSPINLQNKLDVIKYLMKNNISLEVETTISFSGGLGVIGGLGITNITPTLNGNICVTGGFGILNNISTQNKYVDELWENILAHK